MNKINKTILIVDDNYDILESVQLLLEDFGFNVVISDNGSYLDNLGNNNLPDIILLDLLLSGKDGRDIIHKLKSQKNIKHIPIILMSAHNSADNLWKESGADDFIAKPFDIDILISVISRHIKKE